MSSAPLVIFTHVPKASGTTLMRVIERTFRSSEIGRLYEVAGKTLEQQREELVQLARSPRRTLKVIVGHEPYGLHRQLDVPAQYFTILREPVERVLSDFEYIKRTPHHRLHGAVTSGELTLTALAERLPNRQTRFLAGLHEGAPTAQDLQAALEHLQSDYVVAGIMERFDESLALIQRSFGWPLQPYTRENVTDRQTSKASLPVEVIETVRRANELDATLYAAAVERFDQQVREAGPALAEHVQKLREASAHCTSHVSFWQHVRNFAARLRAA